MSFSFVSVRPILVLGFLACAPSALLSQECLGRASRKVATSSVTAGAGFGDGLVSGNGGVRFGSETAFASIGGGYDRFTRTELGAPFASMAGGLSLPLGGARAVRLCPILGFTYQHGPNEDTNLYGRIDRSTIAASTGVAVGGIVELSNAVAFVPNFSIEFAAFQSRAENAGDTFTFNDEGAYIDMGLSLLFVHRISIEPTLTIPVGFNNVDPFLSFRLTWGFARHK